MKLGLYFSEFDYEIQYRPGLAYLVSDALSRLLHPSDTQDCEPIDVWNSYVSIQLCGFEAVAEGRRSANYLYFGYFFWDNQRASTVLQCQHYCVHDNLDDDFNSNG